VTTVAADLPLLRARENLALAREAPRTGISEKPRRR
jgi:hypothetical protein